MTASRRTGGPRRALTVLAALAAAGVLAGCGADTAPALDRTAPASAPATSPVAAPAATPRDTDLVMIIRHGEKPEDDALGVDANGAPDEASMTDQGWARAHGLADLLDPTHGDPRPGLARPVTIYAAGATDEGRGQRTRETVLPLAERLGVPVNTRYGKGDEEDLVEHVVAEPGPTLISWQHGEIPDIVEAFGTVTPQPPSEWPDDRFDVVWVLTRTADGWQFSQQPELVLPQDQPTVITG